ncbi:hypothetical protein BH11MYX1_BH11MYX1_04220 [soil metagenome]
MNRRSFLSGSTAGGLLYAVGCRPEPAPNSPRFADGIAYGDPGIRPLSVVIPPSWVEHRARPVAPSAAYTWTDTILEVAAREVEATHVPRVTVISRHMAIASTAMYDAWAAYDDLAVGTRLGARLRRPKSERTLANKAKAIAYGTYRALLDLFPSDGAWLAEQMKSRGLDPADASTDPATPQGIGNLAAAALLEYRHRDGANQLGDEVGGDGTPYSDYTFYQPRNPVGTTNDPDRWQPIEFEALNGGPKVAPGFLTAHWYRVKPLVLDRNDQFRPGPQPKVGSPQLRREIQEVIAFNGGLSLEQKSVVEFMRDGPRSKGQSGHWLEFARDVSRRDKHDLDRDVKVFFAVANTAFEAFIASWDAKRFYDTARPFALVRVVQQLFAGQRIRGYLGPGRGFGTIKAAEWKPYSPGAFVTPPFPGYVSGHSTVSGACAKMLERFTGSDELGVFHHHVAGMNTEPDAKVEQMQAVNGVLATGLPADKAVTLVLPTFTMTADLAGLSRVMGGYHIAADNVAGLELGRHVAELAWPKYQAYFAGTAGVRP